MRSYVEQAWPIVAEQSQAIRVRGAFDLADKFTSDVSKIISGGETDLPVAMERPSRPSVEGLATLTGHPLTRP